MTHQAFVNYYTEVADAIKIPLIIYNVTKFTGVNINYNTIAELSEHQNIAGIKDSTTSVEQLRQTINNVQKDFVVLAGTGSVLLPALMEGAKGGVLALANVAPAECVRIFDLFNDKKLNEAENIQSTLIPVNQAITSSYGAAGLKAAMDMVGYYGGNPRLPLETLDEYKKKELKNILMKASLIK
jgi:4-hydroxy-2-oxoglutarate aldolase